MHYESLVHEPLRGSTPLHTEVLSTSPPPPAARRHLSIFDIVWWGHTMCRRGTPWATNEITLL
jgi:hypothetical protein